MSQPDEQLYGLMEIAERQQAAVQTALEGLAAERAALAREREQLAQAQQALELGTRTAVRGAVEDSMARAAGIGVEAVQAEAALRRVVPWASWHLLGWGVATIAALAVLWWLASSAVLWWDAGAIGAAQVQKAQLEAEIAALLATWNGWQKAGMLGKLEQCGAGRRPWIRVDENAGQFKADGTATTG